MEYDSYEENRKCAGMDDLMLPAAPTLVLIVYWAEPPYRSQKTQTLRGSREAKHPLISCQ